MIFKVFCSDLVIKLLFAIYRQHYFYLICLLLEIIISAIVVLCNSVYCFMIMITLRHCKLTHAMDRHFVSLRWCPSFQCRGSPFLLNQKFKPKIKFYKYKFRAKGKSPREFSISNHGRYLMLLKKSANLFIT